eukprot:5452759-Heterocapsa_arctica.AAC.1
MPLHFLPFPGFRNSVFQHAIDHVQMVWEVHALGQEMCTAGPTTIDAKVPNSDFMNQAADRPEL